MNEIIIYQNKDNQTQVEVRFEDETAWLTQPQIVTLFDSSKANISEHIKNIFDSGELDEEPTVRKFRTVQIEGNREVSRERLYYNLDLIISIGYRVNSKRGVQFRQWATQRLKEYLVDGYAINQKRLEERNLELQHLKTGIAILRRAIEYQAQDLIDAKHLAGMLEQFSGGLALLDDYDHETLDNAGKTKREAVIIEAADYRKVIDAMRGEFASELFGKKKDTSFGSSIRQIYQSFGGTEMYPSVEEKAAMLLYLIVKNHSFVDGNKRIAAACFLYFLERNGLLYHKSGETVISNEALASLTLFIAVSKPEEMQTVKQVAVSILNRTAS